VTDDGNRIDGARYRTVLGRYPTGVTVVTGMDGDDPVALVIGSFVSVSLDPPLVGFLPGKSSTSWPRIEPSARFCVNVLGDDQLDVCNAFFRKGEDPWERVGWASGATGSPILDGVIAFIDCTLHQVVDAGDHWMVIGEVVDMGQRDDGGPLLFLGGGYGRYEALG
jgi:3-hydroxy-9,10-secoandrosta-1,3,5(10)-triene-9,17-dione monooxygenase reductase component